MIEDFKNTEDDYQLEQSRYFSSIVRNFYRSVKGRERLELSATSAVQPFLEDAIPLVVDGFKAACAVEAAKGSADTKEWYPLLRDLDPVLLAVIAISRCMDGVAKRWSISHLNVQIGKAVDTNIFAEAAQAAFAQQLDRGKSQFNKMVKQTKESTADFDRRVKLLKHYVGKRGLMIGHTGWDDETAAKVGLGLFSIIQQSTDIFDVYTVWRKGKIQSSQDRIGFIQEIQDQIDENNLQLDWNSAQYRPMVVFPNDWTDNALKYGPYHDEAQNVATPLVKNVLPLQKHRLVAQLKSGNMQECLDAINTLQRVPYKINQFTFDALIWVKDSLLDEPLEHSKFPPLTPVHVPEKTEENSKGPEAAKRHRKIIRQKLVESSHMQVEADIAEAESLLDRPDRPFWLPHHFDTRGRVYHIPSFGHHRADYVRGLFLFADLKPVTQENLHHLYYQVANTWAGPVSDTDSRKTDKISMAERYQWTHDNLEVLLEVGKDFVTSFDHWSQAGEPFQHLAACRELYLATEHGEGYMTGLPIGFDGANSGLQHYAMASKWKSDGYKVNLVPNLPQPEDCYQYIADYSTNIAELAVAKDKATLDALNEGFENAPFNKKRQDHAKGWLDVVGIDRKVTKSNTMTWPYSVTMVGMADQLRDNIMDGITKHCDDNNEPHPFGSDSGFAACNTMARINWHSITSVIESGARGMEFMRQVAGTLAQANKHLQWTSLIGFPCSQEYNTEVMKRPKGFLFDQQGGRQYRMTLQVSTNRLSRKDSLSGAAPNFVHHLDSTHLMMAVNKAKDYGVTNLMVVHDSFSTDIESASVMLECIKATAVEMYEGTCHFQNLLDDARSLVSDPDSIAIKNEIATLNEQMAQIDAEDEEAIEAFQQQILSLEARILRWPEIPPKGEGDNALDIYGIMDCQYAFA